jgi:Ni/Fe-hydrogenase subunit HybB-like protein
MVEITITLGLFAAMVLALLLLLRLFPIAEHAEIEEEA